MAASFTETPSPVFPERGSLKGQRFHCCHFDGNHKSCTRQAAWLIQVGSLRLPACGLHREAVRAAFTPEIRTWELAWLRDD